MKRYLLFAYHEPDYWGDDNGAKGGMEDFHGDFDEIAEARRHLDTLERFDHAEVLDITDGRRISFDESPPCAEFTQAPTPIDWKEGVMLMDFRPLDRDEVAAAMALPTTLLPAGPRDFTPPGTVAVTPAAAGVIAEHMVSLCPARSAASCLLLHGGHDCRYHGEVAHDSHICHCDTEWSGEQR